MRRTLHISVFLLSSLVALGGCKIVKNPDPGAAGQAQKAQTDQARMAALAREIWEPQVLPAVAALLAPLDDVRAALAQDVDAAGAKYGYKPVGEASAWNFGVTGTGVIVETKMKSRAAKLQVDTVGDGKADVTIQLGPIIRGTALRDAMSFLSFSDFRDQIEFAKPIIRKSIESVAIEARSTGRRPNRSDNAPSIGPNRKFMKAYVVPSPPI